MKTGFVVSNLARRIWMHSRKVHSFVLSKQTTLEKCFIPDIWILDWLAGSALEGEIENIILLVNCQFWQHCPLKTLISP